jgi:hypothetical protein
LVLISPEVVPATIEDEVRAELWRIGKPGAVIALITDRPAQIAKLIPLDGRPEPEPVEDNSPPPRFVLKAGGLNVRVARAQWEARRAQQAEEERKAAEQAAEEERERNAAQVAEADQTAPDQTAEAT